MQEVVNAVSFNYRNTELKVCWCNMSSLHDVDGSDPAIIQLNPQPVSEKLCNVSCTTDETPISKRQLKRIKKELHRASIKEELLERRRYKNRRRRRRNKEQRKKIILAPTIYSKRHVVIDFSYNHLMSSRDTMRALNQGMRCYGSNRRFEKRFHLHFTSFTKDVLLVAQKHNGFLNWDVNFHESGFLDIFDHSKIIYLTSESENTIDVLEDDMVYIIGGLVDHNAHKGASYKKAVTAGIKHAHLPIKEHFQIATRCVLPINHVFDILLFINNGYDWKEALLKAIPNRNQVFRDNTSDSSLTHPIEIDGADDSESDYTSISTTQELAGSSNDGYKNNSNNGEIKEVYISNEDAESPKME